MRSQCPETIAIWRLEDGSAGAACCTTSTPPAGSKSFASTSTVVGCWPCSTAASGIAIGGTAEVGSAATSTRILPFANGASPYATRYVRLYDPGRAAVTTTVPVSRSVVTTVPAGLGRSPAS